MLSQNTCILCVDDNHDNVELVEMMLRKANENYQVVAATSPIEALALINCRKFDLYILDEKMPYISGVELCKRIRAVDRHAPVIFLTAMARDCDRDGAMNAGASEFLVKPDGLFSLVETVERLIQKRIKASDFFKVELASGKLLCLKE